MPGGLIGIISLALIGIVAVALIVLVVTVCMFATLWMQVLTTKVPVSLFDLLTMRLRRVAPRLVVDCMIRLRKAGVEVRSGELEAHVLAGGDLSNVTEAMISAEKASLGFSFQQLAAIGLAGRDVLAAVSAHVRPKVITCPGPGSPSPVIAGVCQDGVRLGARGRVTVRTRLDRLVGGAGEETIAARVGEGIVAAIGRADSHKDILQNPEAISEYLLAQGLDSGTCFEVVSVDIADVDVMGNVGARLQSAQAESDKRVARAQAEMRRAAAVATRQEMLARTTDMRSRVVAAKATVPLGVSSAFWEGNLGRLRPLRGTAHGRVKWKAAGP